MSTSASGLSEEETLVHVPRHRDIPTATQNLLWGRAAGRCEFRGCNEPLWKSAVTQESVNVAEKAHIYAFSARGPRGNSDLEPCFLNDVSNLLLMCHNCHRTIDATPRLLERYGAARLKEWKAEHEERVARATSIAPGRSTSVLLYGANIGTNRSILRFDEASDAIFPDRFPDEDRAIVLGMVNSAIGDDKPSFWEREAENLKALFEKRVAEPRSTGHIGHLSVFALAPQPLLILLGSLLIDIDAADVYQRRREPATWRWADDEKSQANFITREPASFDGPPALMLSLSATIAPDRVRRIDPTYSIWEVTIGSPHNDFLHDRGTLRRFREIIRSLLVRINVCHAKAAELAIFPAMPVACAVELGRVRMPKADLPWRIYDQLPHQGFASAICIPFGSGTGRRGV